MGRQRHTSHILTTVDSGGFLLRRMFLQLNSGSNPLRSFGGVAYRVAYRVAWTVARHMFNVFQSAQVLFNVGIMIIHNGQSLSQISKGSVCFVILCLVWAIAGAPTGQIPTLEKLCWLANFAIWVNVLMLIITTAVIFHSNLNYGSAGQQRCPQGPVVTTANSPDSFTFAGQLVGLVQARLLVRWSDAFR
ncbi:MAG: hypothetical protein Q9207_000759 [Kuettlingeria erythrocarpa]